MSGQTEVNCWEVMQCKGHSSCLLKNKTQRNCWEHVETHADYLFHICVDCLVYVAQKKDSTLGHDEFNAIMAQRKTIGIQTHKCSLDHVIC